MEENEFKGEFYKNQPHIIKTTFDVEGSDVEYTELSQEDIQELAHAIAVSLKEDSEEVKTIIKNKEYTVISPLGKRSGYGTFETFFDTGRFRSIEEAKDDCVVVDFVKNSSGRIFFHAYRKDDKSRFSLYELERQNFPAGVDVADDNAACAMAENLFNTEREFEVWTEGYAATGEHGTATFHGKVAAKNLDEACIKLLGDSLDKDSSRPDGYGRGSSGNYKVWACNCYDNETDARMHFG